MAADALLSEQLISLVMGNVLIWRCHLDSMWNITEEIQWYCNCLISTMELPTLVKKKSTLISHLDKQVSYEKSKYIYMTERTMQLKIHQHLSLSNLAVTCTRSSVTAMLAWLWLKYYIIILHNKYTELQALNKLCSCEFWRLKTHCFLCY